MMFAALLRLHFLYQSKNTSTMGPHKRRQLHHLLKRNRDGQAEREGMHVRMKKFFEILIS